MKSSQLAHTFPSPSGANPVSAITFSENGTWLASANSGQTTVTVWDLRKLKALRTINAGLAVTGLAWDYTGQFLAASGSGGVVVSQYTKSSKTWSTPLTKALHALDVKWGSKAQSLVALTDSALVVLGA